MKSQESGLSEPSKFGPGNPEPDALPFRRQRFCQAYAHHGNAARAVEPQARLGRIDADAGDGTDNGGVA